MKTLALKKGFTLIELLMAISLFMILLTVSSNSFISIIRNQTAANEVRQIYSELRNLIDLVNDEMRGGEIDFYCYSESTDPNDFLGTSAKVRCQDQPAGFGDNNSLRVIAVDGLTSSIIFHSAPDSEGNVNIFLRRWRNINGSWEPDAGFGTGPREILFANVKVKKLIFEVLPKIQLGQSKKLWQQIQPSVSINLQVEGINNFKLDYQTLITSRTYNQ